MNKQKFIIDVIRHLQKFEDQLDITGDTTEVAVDIDDYIDDLRDKYFSKK